MQKLIDDYCFLHLITAYTSHQNQNSPVQPWCLDNRALPKNHLRPRRTLRSNKRAGPLVIISFISFVQLLRTLACGGRKNAVGRRFLRTAEHPRGLRAAFFSEPSSADGVVSSVFGVFVSHLDADYRAMGKESQMQCTLIWDGERKTRTFAPPFSEFRGIRSPIYTPLSCRLYGKNNS